MTLTLAKSNITSFWKPDPPNLKFNRRLSSVWNIDSCSAFYFFRSCSARLYTTAYNNRAMKKRTLKKTERDWPKKRKHERGMLVCSLPFRDSHCPQCSRVHSQSRIHPLEMPSDRDRTSVRSTFLHRSNLRRTGLSFGKRPSQSSDCHYQLDVVDRFVLSIFFKKAQTVLVIVIPGWLILTSNCLATSSRPPLRFLQLFIKYLTS